MPNPDAVTYYARRAPHYDNLYAKPERQEDLAALGGYIQTALAGHNVLEIACGTGYWTQVIAETAASVTATDINEPMLEIARQKDFPLNNVVFENRDMYNLKPTGAFDALFGGFIWSHIPLEQLESWVDHLHGLLKPGSRVVFTDNNYVVGSSTPVAETDIHGNTLQQRKLENGEAYMIIKNFPTRQEFERLLEKRGQNIEVRMLDYYWLLAYDLS